MVGQFVVIGLGMFGRNVALNLARSGQAVLAIDLDQEEVDRLAPDLDSVIRADATDEEALRELRLERMSCAVVAIGAQSMEASILTTALLRQIGVPRIVARSLSELHARVLRAVGAHEVVSPEEEMGQRLARRLAEPSVLERLELGDDAQLAELAAPESFIGKSLVELDGAPAVRRHGGGDPARRLGARQHRAGRPDSARRRAGGDRRTFWHPPARHAGLTMKLRTRILFGYWYLVGLLIVGAAGAALSFLSLGRSIGIVLEENFDSVRASMAMLDALERQDSALLSQLLGDAEAEKALEASERAFVSAVAAARANVTIAGEIEVLDTIDDGHAKYLAARDRLLEGSWERPLAAYQAETLPLFMALKQSVYDLLDLNHRAMVEADQRAQSAARNRAIVHGMLVAGALLSLAFLSQALGREVLARLSGLSSVAQAIAAGDTVRRAVPGGNDELGVVARQLNAMLDHAQSIEAELEGRLRQDRQLLLGLLGQLPQPAALLSLGGGLVASTLPAGDFEAVEAAVAGLDTRKLLAHGSVIREARDGRAIELRLLETEVERPVGWLAMVRSGED